MTAGIEGIVLYCDMGDLARICIINYCRVESVNLMDCIASIEEIGSISPRPPAYLTKRILKQRHLIILICSRIVDYIVSYMSRKLLLVLMHK